MAKYGRNKAETMKQVFSSAEIKVRGMSGREFYVTIGDGVGYCADGGVWRDISWPEPTTPDWEAAQVWQIE